MNINEYRYSIKVYICTHVFVYELQKYICVSSILTKLTDHYEDFLHSCLLNWIQTPSFFFFFQNNKMNRQLIANDDISPKI